MAREDLQVRIVTGEGLLQDQDWGAFENLDEKEVAEAARRFGLAGVGTLLDFVHPEALGLLLADEQLVSLLLPELATCWQARQLEPGTAYGVLLGPESAKDFAQRAILQQLQAEKASDRYKEARSAAGFTTILDQSSTQAQTNVWKAERGQISAKAKAQLLRGLALPEPAAPRPKKGTPK